VGGIIPEQKRRYAGQKTTLSNHKSTTKKTSVGNKLLRIVVKREEGFHPKKFLTKGLTQVIKQRKKTSWTRKDPEDDIFSHKPKRSYQRPMDKHLVTGEVSSKGDFRGYRCLLPVEVKGELDSRQKGSIRHPRVLGRTGARKIKSAAVHCNARRGKSVRVFAEPHMEIAYDMW